MTKGLITPTEALDRFKDYIKLTPDARAKRDIVYNINYLLCMFAMDETNMAFNAAYLQVALERFGVSDVCHIMVREDGKLRLYYDDELNPNYKGTKEDKKNDK